MRSRTRKVRDFCFSAYLFWEGITAHSHGRGDSAGCVLISSPLADKAARAAAKNVPPAHFLNATGSPAGDFVPLGSRPRAPGASSGLTKFALHAQAPRLSPTGRQPVGGPIVSRPWGSPHRGFARRRGTGQVQSSRWSLLTAQFAPPLRPRKVR